jgi:hypothetical protein
MKRFIKHFVFFIIPIIIWPISEGLLPITTFTFRHFEALSFKSKVPHLTRFYPNINSEMKAVGDLCHHTDNSIIKIEKWRTDELGFRNNKFTEEADILLIGDSFIQGSSLSQEETISSKIDSKTNTKLRVYNMAPSSMSEFDRLIKSQIIKPPKLLIYSIVERNIPKNIISYDIEKSITKDEIKSFFGAYNLNVFIDKALKQYSVDFIKARINNVRGHGIPAIGNSKMFFLNGIKQKYNDENLITTSKKIIAYKKYCDSIGIDFLFLPMPNKETVYYELVPFSKQPNYLFRLDSILTHSNIKTINTLKVYNEYLKENKTLLYHLDDTHWNSNATDIIAEEIIKMQKTRTHNTVYN